tara:strand:+ start:64 stop:1467 length:1404 start_codon:yes stop_codon:yes gene_type:complete
VSNKQISIYSSKGKKLIEKYIEQIGGKPIVSKTICKKYKKTRIPICSEQSDCRWIKNKKSKNGCFSNKEAIEISNKLKIKKIIGPITFYLWDITCPNGVNKKILMMGDYHDNVLSTCKKEKTCLDLPNFIEWIINKSNKCLDFIIERPPNQLSRPLFIPNKTGFDVKIHVGGFKKNAEVLPQLEEYFYGCAFHSRGDLLEKNDKLKCQHKNLRYHNFDVRFSYDDSDNAIFERNDGYLDVIIGKWKEVDERLYNHSTDYSILADYILGLPIKNKDKLDRILYKCIADSKSPKDFIKIKEHMNEFRKLIRKEYLKYKKTSKQYFSKKLDLLKIIKEIVRKSYLEKLKDRDEEHDELTLLFTDLYTLSRIFMEFKTNKNKRDRSPELCKIVKSGNKTINISPNKVIIFAGDDHIQVYNQVLEQAFGKKSLLYFTTKEHENKIIRPKDIKTKKNIKSPKTFNEIIDRFLD